jgi:hypothetical protein
MAGRSGNDAMPCMIGSKCQQCFQAATARRQAMASRLDSTRQNRRDVLLEGIRGH